MAKAPKAKSPADARPSDEGQFHACSLPEIADRPLSPDLHPGRMRLIRVNEKKWANGTVLRARLYVVTRGIRWGAKQAPRGNAPAR